MGGQPSGKGLQAGGFDLRSMPVEAGLVFRNFGTKDEAFFDSQEWLESDCEDDFFSENGDFSPSHGNTPNYQTGTPMKLQLHEVALISDGFPDTISEPSPRKTLAELLQETMAREPAGNKHNTVGEKMQMNGKSESNKSAMDQFPHSLDGAPCLSIDNSFCGGERTPDGDFRNGKGKRKKAMQCCLPSFVRSLSFNEKKQMPRMSPRCHGGG